MKILYTTFFIALTAFSFAQNASEDFKKMNKYYLSHEHISMDIEYLFYENHQSKKAIDVQWAKYKKSGSKFYYAMDGITTIQNDKHKLVLNSSNKIILVTKKQKEIDSKVFTGATMDSVLTLCKRIDYTKMEGGKKHYVLTYKSSNYFPYKKLVIVLNSNNSLSKMIYYYNRAINYTPDENDVEEAPRMEIVYKNTSTKVIATYQYSLSKYVKIQGKKISAVSKYLNYRLINQLM